MLFGNLGREQTIPSVMRVCTEPSKLLSRMQKQFPIIYLTHKQLFTWNIDDEIMQEFVWSLHRLQINVDHDQSAQTVSAAGPEERRLLEQLE